MINIKNMKIKGGKVIIKKRLKEDNKWYCSDGWYVLVNGNDSAKTKFMNIAGAALDGSLLYPGDHLIVVAGWA